MTVYHFVPGVKIAKVNHLAVVVELSASDSDSLEFKKEMKEYKHSLNQKRQHADLAAASSSGNKRAHGYSLAEPGELHAVLQKMESGDTLVIHAEGEPFVIGFREPTIYDLYPHLLLDLLVSNGLSPDKAITIDLKCCHSACEYRGMNFARDFARLLGHKQFNQVQVTGYTGLIIEKPGKKNIKFSCQSDPYSSEDRSPTADGMTKKDLKHVEFCSIEDAHVTYNSKGSIVSQGVRGAKNPLSDLSAKPFDWASGYIAQYKSGLPASRQTNAAHERSAAGKALDRSGLLSMPQNKAAAGAAGMEAPEEAPDTLPKSRADL